jgi:hypothetical protein
MLRIPFVLAAGLALSGCQAGGESSRAGPRFSGGNGLTVEHAIVITGGGNDVENKATEYAWIFQHRSDVKVTGPTVFVTPDKRVLDKLDVVALQDGSTKSYYFDTGKRQ